MKRFIWIAGAAGLMWTVPALGQTSQAAPADHSHAAHAQANGDRKHSGHGAQGSSTKGHQHAAGSMNHQMAGHADQANHTGAHAQHHAKQMPHDRAMSHSARDGNAAHADVANRAAAHMTSGMGSQGDAESLDAAMQMRMAHDHGEMGGMQGGGAMGGGSNEGGGRMGGSQGGM